MNARKMTKTINIVVLVIALISMGYAVSIPDANAFAATTAYLSAPYTAQNVQVQQGWVSHFAWYNAKTGNCGYYNSSNVWVPVAYTPKSTINGTYCYHKGIDFILGTPQSSSSTWKPFNVVATMNGKVVCAYSSSIGNYITQTQTYKDGNTIKVRYVHLKSTMHCGENVVRGTQIGIAGDTGSGAQGKGIHLHLDVWKNNVAVDSYGINKKWNYYPPYASVDWNLLNELWMIENNRIRIISAP